MVDILDEAREEFKQEQLLALFKQYGKYLGVLFVALLVFVASNQWWKGHKAARDKAVSIAYFDALESVRAGKRQEALDKLKAVSEQGGSYAMLAGLLNAAALNGEKKMPEAIAAYEKIASGGGDRALRELAALMAAELKLQQNNADKDAIESLQNLSKPGHAWRFSAREILGFHYVSQKQYDEAKAEFKAISTDPATPAALRQRASDMLLYVAGLENNGK